VRNIAYEMLIYMEKKQILFVTAIQKRNIKKDNNGKGETDNGRKAFEAGRLHERKLLIAVLQRERDRARSIRS
tara:strand:- start:116 stop:334 length:219 start_codon:yes stop_codon:yes gene_type:complete